MTWLTTTELTEITGITGSESFLQRALDFAEKDVIRHIFISRIDKTAEITTDHQLVHSFTMDIDGDEVVTTSDLDVYEFDTDDNIYDLNDYKQSFTPKERRLILTEEKPTSGRTMVIEYKTGREHFEDMLTELQEVEALIASNYIFNKKPMTKLQDGISNWSLNGVNVSFDSSAMRQVIEDNNVVIRNLYNQLRPKRPVSGFRIGEKRKYNMFRKPGVRVL